MGSAVTDYRAIDRHFVCVECGTPSMVTMVVGLNDPDPEITVVHLPDGTHAPRIAGNSPAAMARRNSPLARLGRVLR
jgi:hypothetical protein